MLDPFHFFYHPETGPVRDEEAEQRYRDLVLVVRGGVPIRKTVAGLRLDPTVIERLKADGIIDAALKPIRPIDQSCWSEEFADLDAAMIRLFADHLSAVLPAPA